MFEKLFEGKTKNTEQEAVQNILDSYHSFEDSLYTEEVARIDKERADTYKTFFSSMMDMCTDNPEKEKAFKDVIAACVLVKYYPSSKNSRLLDDKLELAQKYIN